MHSFSDKTGEDDVSLLLVLVTELFAIGALLTLGPANHLCSTNRDKESDGPVTADKDDSDPGKHLIQIVWASDNAETITNGNLALSATSRTQTRKILVNEGIHKLAKAIKSNANGINGRNVGLGCKGVGVVDGVGAENTRDSPVEEAVLEDVLPGHCVGRKLVDKERLILALEEV